MVQEREYKFLLDKEKFYEIKEILSNKYKDAVKTEHIQINYYYDTDDKYLLENHTTLRVRQIEDKLKLELKESLPAMSEFSTSIENSQTIKEVKNDITLQEGKFAWIPFMLQGNLVTNRFSIRPSKSLSIDFDVNYYFGRCDYEIEMEFTQNAQKATKMLVDSLDLMPFKNKVGGKARRFFSCKSEMTQEG